MMAQGLKAQTTPAIRPKSSNHTRLPVSPAPGTLTSMASTGICAHVHKPTHRYKAKNKSKPGKCISKYVIDYTQFLGVVFLILLESNHSVKEL